MGGGGGGGRMTSEQFSFLCCYNRSANFFCWACAVQIFSIVIFFSGRCGEGGGGGLKLGQSICVSP